MTKNINQQTITTQLTALEPGMQLIYGGNKLYTVTETLANQFKAGDKIMFIENHDEPIIIPGFAITLVNEKIMHKMTQSFKTKFHDVGQFYFSKKKNMDKKI